MLLDVQGFKMVAKKTMSFTEHKETLKTWLLMSDEFSGTGFANSLADYENVLRVCCRNEWGRARLRGGYTGCSIRGRALCLVKMCDHPLGNALNCCLGGLSL